MLFEKPEDRQRRIENWLCFALGCFTATVIILYVFGRILIASVEAVSPRSDFSRHMNMKTISSEVIKS